MRKAVVAGLSAVALVVAAFVLAPVVWSEIQPAPAPRPEVRRMWLDGRGSSIGVRVRDVEADDVTRAKLPQPSGAVIADVDEDGPAARAGLRDGDVVVEFDGERVRSARHLARLVQETPDGRTVKATIVRDGARRTIEVAPSSAARFGVAEDMLMDLPDIHREVERGLRAMPRNFSFDFDWDAAPGVIVAGRNRLGARLQSLSSQLAEYFGAKEGVLVSEVERDSPAARAGLKAGDVITSVNGRSVGEPRDVVRELRDAGQDESVELGVMRDRQTLTLKAQVEPRRPAARRYTRPA